MARSDDRVNINNLPSDIATSRVLSEVFNQFGLDSIVDGHNAIVKLSKRTLLDGIVHGLPKSKVLFEINDTFLDDDTIMDEIRRLKSQGMRFIYNNYSLSSNAEPLLPYCDIVKIDVKNVDTIILEHLVQSLEPFRAKALADKVETYDALERCKQAGFDLFQGYFLYEPKIIRSHGMETTKTNLMHLLKELNNPDITTGELEAIISRDVTLSYKLMRYIESAAVMSKNKVASIRTGIIYLGMESIKNWASIIALSSMTEKPVELINQSLIRAHMCQLLAENTDADEPSSYFLAGLFSSLDALLDMPMDDVIKNMPVIDEVKHALLNEGGEINNILQLTLNYEKGNWLAVQDADMEGRSASHAYLKSLKWAEDFQSAISAV
ncbi:MAG: HDOD domain-containing protein [Gammaproteobacteria bacterium]|nr:HDOD domain-containing protein [Gammaproteobacteria bacterium]